MPCAVIRYYTALAQEMISIPLTQVIQGLQLSLKT